MIIRWCMGWKVTWAATPPETPKDSTAHMFMKAVNSYMVCRQHLATMAISTCITTHTQCWLSILGVH